MAQTISLEDVQERTNVVQLWAGKANLGSPCSELADAARLADEFDKWESKQRYDLAADNARLIKKRLQTLKQSGKLDGTEYGSVLYGNGNASVPSLNRIPEQDCLEACEFLVKAYEDLHEGAF